MKKPKIKTKIKSKPKSKDKVKINKQNQHVKVHIKIGNDGKTIDHRQPNSITTYPLLQNSQPPINIIHNHENRHPPLAPPHIPIAPPLHAPPVIPPLHTPAIATPIKRKINIRKKLRKVDEIPTPTNYESDLRLLMVPFWHSALSYLPLLPLQQKQNMQRWSLPRKKQ